MNDSSFQAVVVQSMQDLYHKIIVYLPNLLAAFIVVVLGWLIAIFLSKLVQKLLEMIKVDTLANQLGLSKLSERAGKTLSIAKLGAWLVKWFFFLGSFIAATEILGLTEVSKFLYQDVLSYAGHVIVAMAILLLGVLAANFFSGLVETTVRASGMHSAKSLGALTRWAIVIFATVAALSELLPTASSFLQDLFKAVVAMLAIAGGIAFGLGGRDHASKALSRIEDSLTKKD